MKKLFIALMLLLGTTAAISQEVTAPVNGGTGVSSPTGYLYGNGASPATASTTIPAANINWTACPTSATTGTVTVNLTTANCAIITATGGNVTVAVTSPNGPGPYAIRLCNDTTARTWTLPGSFLQIGVPYAASFCSTSVFMYDGTNYDGLGSNETPSTMRFSATRSAPASPSASAGGVAWVDSTDLDFEYQNGGAPFKMFLSGQDCNPVTGTCFGNPSTNGYILSSTTAGVRSWIAPASGGSGGDTITSPNSTLTVGGTSTNTTIDEVANTYWSPFPFGNSSAPPTPASNTVQGIGFMIPTPVTFSNINVQSDVADASGEYSVAIANSSGTLICHPTTAQHMGTAHTIMTYPCNEGTVTLYPGNVYIFLGTGNATTGLLVTATATQFIVPFYSASISGFSSSGGVISGTGTGISLAPAVPGAAVPEFLLH